MNRRGLALVEVSLSLLMLLIAVSAYILGTRSSSSLSRYTYEKLAAQAYAVELVEFFRSHTPQELLAYLQTGPGPYPLCSHINLLDRMASTATNPVMINTNPSVNLGVDNTLSTTAADMNSNRYYQIQVVDISTMATRPEFCRFLPSQICLNGGGCPNELGPNDRLMVTVGVSWISRGDRKTEPQSVVASVPIP